MFHNYTLCDQSNSWCRISSRCIFICPEATAMSHCFLLNAVLCCCCCCRGLPLRPEEPDCAFYVRNGWCAFSDTCKFHHPDLPQASRRTATAAAAAPCSSSSTPAAAAAIYSARTAGSRMPARAAAAAAAAGTLTQATTSAAALAAACMGHMGATWAARVLTTWVTACQVST